MENDNCQAGNGSWIGDVWFTNEELEDFDYLIQTYVSPPYTGPENEDFLNIIVDTDA